LTAVFGEVFKYLREVFVTALHSCFHIGPYIEPYRVICLGQLSPEGLTQAPIWNQLCYL